MDSLKNKQRSNYIDVPKIGVASIRIANDNIQNNEFITLKDWNAIYRYIIGME